MRDLAEAGARDSANEEVHTRTGGSGGEEGSEEGVDRALVRARQHLLHLEGKAGVAMGRVAEELQKEAVATADREAALASARQQMLKASVAVEEVCVCGGGCM